MITPMSRIVREEPKVFGAIIARDPVPVMGDLYAGQFATDLHSEDNARERISMTIDANIPATTTQMSPALPVGILVATRSSTDLGACRDRALAARVLVATKSDAHFGAHIRATDAAVSVSFSTRFDRVPHIEIIPMRGNF